jgi:hypothetical protein
MPFEPMTENEKVLIELARVCVARVSKYAVHKKNCSNQVDLPQVLCNCGLDEHRKSFDKALAKVQPLLKKWGVGEERGPL